MATLQKAEDLLEQLREASYGAAQQDMQDVKEFAASQASACSLPLICKHATSGTCKCVQITTTCAAQR